jgi:hypothetical protein
MIIAGTTKTARIVRLDETSEFRGGLRQNGIASNRKTTAAAVACGGCSHSNQSSSKSSSRRSATARAISPTTYIASTLIGIHLRLIVRGPLDLESHIDPLNVKTDDEAWNTPLPPSPSVNSLEQLDQVNRRVKYGPTLYINHAERLSGSLPHLKSLTTRPRNLHCGWFTYYDYVGTDAPRVGPFVHRLQYELTQEEIAQLRLRLKEDISPEAHHCSRSITCGNRSPGINLRCQSGMFRGTSQQLRI